MSHEKEISLNIPVGTESEWIDNPSFLKKWRKEEIDFLIENYPNKGKAWCVQMMNKSDSSIRQKASKLGLKQNKNSEFFKDWQERARLSKIGKKRPEQAVVMKKLHESGKLKLTDEAKKIIGEKAKKRIAEKGHPRGALGLKFSEESKKKISENSKRMWENMSDEMRQKMSLIASKNGQKVSAKNRSHKTTWKAGWRSIGSVDKYYRSRWEANYARYLEWLKQNKQIKDWKHEPKTFWFKDIKRGAVSYLPDFWIVGLNDEEEFHEVKGWMDDRSKTKLKRMAKYYPNVKLVLIDSRAYKSIERDIKSLIKDWE